jgi:hypothetical protein
MEAPLSALPDETRRHLSSPFCCGAGDSGLLLIKATWGRSRSIFSFCWASFLPPLSEFDKPPECRGLWLRSHQSAVSRLAETLPGRRLLHLFRNHAHCQLSRRDECKVPTKARPHASLLCSQRSIERLRNPCRPFRHRDRPASLSFASWAARQPSPRW